jgi:predicted short-subunit dehydrogenase-like oxidoreductase (DUF2520 family)
VNRKNEFITPFVTAMTRTLAIVGAGRVGRVLGARLHALGWNIGAVITRHRATARTAVRVIGGGTPFGELTCQVLAAEVVLLTTRDDDLATVARELAACGGKEWRDKVVLHTSGALPAAVLAPLAQRGARTGSMHPMQTFGARSQPNLDGVLFAVEGDAGAVRVARGIVRSLGGLPVRIEARNKAAYHCAGSYAAGHVLASIEAGTRILEGTGFTRKQAMRALLSLSRQMLDNFERLGPHAAWTGPLSRGDFAIVTKHAEVLRRYPAEYLGAYAALARLAIHLLAKSPRGTRARLNQVLRTPRRKTDAGEQFDR